MTEFSAFRASPSIPTEHAATSNAPAHTPGPWVAVRDHCHFDTLSTVEAGASGRFPGRQMLVQVGGFCRFAEQEANARLIAAAPDLLEAAQKIATSRDTFGRFSQIEEPSADEVAAMDDLAEAAFAALRAAILKATTASSVGIAAGDEPNKPNNPGEA